MNLTSDTVGLSMPIDSNFYLPAGKNYREIINAVETYTENHERYCVIFYQETSLQYYEKNNNEGYNNASIVIIGSIRRNVYTITTKKNQ